MKKREREKKWGFSSLFFYSKRRRESLPSSFHYFPTPSLRAPETLSKNDCFLSNKKRRFGSHTQMKVFSTMKRRVKTVQNCPPCLGFSTKKRKRKKSLFHAAAASAPPLRAAHAFIAPSIVSNTSSTFPEPSTFTITCS